MTQVCYLGGFGRSGTTLLERMLSVATSACALGEVVFLWDRGIARNEKCGCGQRFSDCPFWREVGELAFGGWHTVDTDHVAALRQATDRTRHIPSLAMTKREHRLADEYAEYFARVYDAAAQVSGAPSVIDSSKHPSTAFVIRLNPRVDLKVIHVVRDSRGVAYSWTKDMVRPEAAEDGPDSMMSKYSPWRAALLWDAHNVSLMLLAASGVPTRRLKYEELLADPMQTIADLARFIDSGADPARVFVDDRTVRLPAAHQVSGNPSRFKSGEIVLRHDEAWRSSFGAGPRTAVSALTLPLLARYGYLRESSPRRAS